MGEHTEEVLRELGYSDEQIEAMITAGHAAGLKRLD
jgi:crotonobetainyl-CoA:carnitine CoA-transferase CaiB-like acyl-CoA transferase